VALLFGVLVFRERPSYDPIVIATELVGLAAVLTGVSFLAGATEAADPLAQSTPMARSAERPGRI